MTSDKLKKLTVDQFMKLDRAGYGKASTRRTVGLIQNYMDELSDEALDLVDVEPLVAEVKPAPVVKAEPVKPEVKIPESSTNAEPVLGRSEETTVLSKSASKRLKHQKKQRKGEGDE